MILIQAINQAEKVGSKKRIKTNGFDPLKMLGCED